jgi:hypothetical protein
MLFAKASVRKASARTGRKPACHRNPARNGGPRSHARPEPRIRHQRARARWYRNTSSAALSPRRSARLTRVVR